MKIVTDEEAKEQGILTKKELQAAVDCLRAHSRSHLVKSALAKIQSVLDRMDP